MKIFILDKYKITKFNLPDKIEDIVEANTEPKDWGFN